MVEPRGGTHGENDDAAPPASGPPRRRGSDRASNKNTACRLKIREGECVACAACPPVCHSLALRMDALKLVLDEDLCDNCSVCTRVCPVGALYLQ